MVAVLVKFDCPGGLSGAFAVAGLELGMLLGGVMLVGVFIGVALSWRS